MTGILDAIRLIVHVLRTSSRAAEKQVGLSGAQLFVLTALAERPSMSITELAERTRTHQSSVSVVAQRLVDQRLVERDRDVADARRVSLRLTATGRTRLRGAPDPAQERLIEAIERMPVRDRTRLLVLLSQLVDGLGIPSGATAAMFFEDDAQTGKRKRNAALGSQSRRV